MALHHPAPMTVHSTAFVQDIGMPFDGHGFTVGIFDSGLGGLSVLREIRARLPRADLVYVADSGHAPYGERDDAYIAERAFHITDFLQDLGANAIVVACNTATAAAVHHLRAQWPQVPVVGVEPGVKPAVALSPSGCIGVLATPLTLASRKFQNLVLNHGGKAEILLQPCPGLAREIEQGMLDSPELRALVEQFAKPLRERGVDTAVLGCTHYPFVEPLFRQALGDDVRILDTASAVARQTANIGQRALDHHPDGIELKTTSGQTSLWSSGEPSHLAKVARLWLGLDVKAGALPKK